jgi:hypothetical protein
VLPGLLVQPWLCGNGLAWQWLLLRVLPVLPVLPAGLALQLGSIPPLL